MKKLKAKYEAIKLSDDFEGWEFTARTNPPLRVVRDISSGDIDTIIPAMVSMIKEWNFIGENDAPLEVSEDSLNELPIDLVMDIAAAYSDRVGNTEKN